VDKSNGNSLIVGIDQQTIEPLNKAKEIWGGHIRKRTRQSPAYLKNGEKSEKICIAYIWQLKNKKVLNFINNIKPFLKIPLKIKQIENALKKSKKKIIILVYVNIVINHFQVLQVEDDMK
jgi:hypothetical protein